MSGAPSLRALFVSGTTILASCTQSTGGELVDFPVTTSGTVDAGPDGHRFQTASGFAVRLSRAELYVGAVYLDQTAPISGSQGGSCILPGTYVGQMTSGFRMNLLSTARVPAPALGHGTTDRALVGQVWLTGGDVNAVDDRTEVLVLEGAVSRADETRPFSAKITIGQNRQATTGLAVGANPICKQRIVSVLTDVAVARAGGLLLRVDVEKLVANVDWSVVLAAPPTGYAFTDAPGADQPSTNLYANLHAGTGTGSPFSLSWTEAP